MQFGHIRKRFASLTTLALAAMLTVGVSASARAADDKSAKSDAAGGITGVLIDKACAEKALQRINPQKIADQHPKACDIKSADAGYGLMAGGKFLAFDDNGNKLAKQYLSDEDNATRIVVEGKQDGGKLAVTAIKAAPEEKEKDADKDNDKDKASDEKPAKAKSGKSAKRGGATGTSSSSKEVPAAPTEK